MIATISLPSWLIDEHAITTATWGLVFVTMLLVFATVILWWDSFSKGREQRERWRREDAQRVESKKPRFEFGLKRAMRKSERVSPNSYTPPTSIVHLWIANLGISGLFIERLFIKHRDFEAGSIEVHQVATTNDLMAFDIPDSFWQKVPGRQPRWKLSLW